LLFQETGKPEAPLSALIRVVAGQFHSLRARGRLQQVTLSVHDQPSVIRHRIVIIAEVDRPVAGPDRPLNLGIVRGDGPAVRPEFSTDAEIIMVDLACRSVSCLIFD